jgi:uncharacterized protein (TIGR02145 family)
LIDLLQIEIAVVFKTNLSTMKKLYFYCLLMIFAAQAMAQEIQLTFDAANAEQKIDSITVLNQRSGKVMKLSGNEILVLNSISTGHGFFSDISDQSFLFPNPSDGFTCVNYITSEEGHVEVKVINASGNVMGSQSYFLVRGNHQFKVTFPADGLYIVSLIRNLEVENLKATSLGKHQREFEINYMGNNGNFTENDLVSKNAALTKTMDYREGDILLFTFFSGNMMAVMTASPSTSRNIRANFHICIDPDNRIYKTVTIGSQVWMAENLAFLPSVSPSSQGSATEPHYYVFDYQGTEVVKAKQIANYKTYGVLYNWPAAMAGSAGSNSNPGKVQGICPAGWHLPADAEWKQLEKTLGMTQSQADATDWRGTNQGTQLKSASGWYSNAFGNNTSGFSAVPGGYLNFFFVSFTEIGGNGYWWSSADYGSTIAWYRYLNNGSATAGRKYTSTGHGFSVRCVKD